MMLELEHRYQVIDMGAQLTVETPQADHPEMTPDRLEREMRQAGIAQAVVTPDRTTPGYLRANNAVARMSVNRPFVAFARINGPNETDSGATARLRSAVRSHNSDYTTPEDIKQYGYDDRFYGFIIDPPQDGLPDEAMVEALAEVDLPVIVHGGEAFPPARVAETFLGYSFPTVITHFGGYPLNRTLMHEAIELLEQYESCYLETSAVRYRTILEQALREHPDRVVFGTGVPMAHPSVGVMEILTLDVPEDKLRRVFSHNPRRVIPGVSE